MGWRALNSPAGGGGGSTDRPILVGLPKTYKLSSGKEAAAAAAAAVGIPGKSLNDPTRNNLLPKISLGKEQMRGEQALLYQL